MTSWIRSSGRPIAFISYPSPVGAFGAANQALAQVAEETGATVIWSEEVFARVPKAERVLIWNGHPNAAIYTEIAKVAPAQKP